MVFFVCFMKSLPIPKPRKYSYVFFYKLNCFNFYIQVYAWYVVRFMIHFISHMEIHLVKHYLSKRLSFPNVIQQSLYCKSGDSNNLWVTFWTLLCSIGLFVLVLVQSSFNQCSFKSFCFVLHNCISSFWYFKFH